MSKITMHLLQSPQIFLDGTPVVLPFKKAEGLLYYLAIKKSITREMASSLFWASNDEQTAKKNLRHTLYTIKKTTQLEIIISPQKQLLSLNPDLEFSIDYDLFMQEDCLEVYQEELLHGFYVKNASEFEEWLELERASLRELYLRKLFLHMAALPSDQLTQMEGYFAQYVKEDPLDERVYQMMMTAYQKNHLYHKGIKVYENLSKLLNTELRISPSKEITALHRELLNAWTESTASDLSETTPSVVHGRSREIKFLTRSYHEFLSGKSVSLLLMGENGVGKTYLMNHFLENLEDDTCLLLQTVCFQAEKDFLFQPWNAIMLQIDRYLSEHNIKVPEHYLNTISNLFPLLGNQKPLSHVPEDITVSYNYRATRNSILKLFTLLGEKTPLILSFDNIQFMDHLSLELLSLIIRERNPNLMLIATCTDVLRPETAKYLNGLFREHFLTKVTIERFSREDVHKLVKLRLGEHALSEDLLDTIYQETEGNAFFLEILLNDFSKQNFQNILSIRTQDILMDRLTELSVDSRQLLDVISLFHDYATLDILEYILNRDTLEIIELLDDLKQHALIEEKVEGNEIKLRFRHNKMQEFVHSQLSPSKRRLLHSRVASYLEQADVLHNGNWFGRLIYHYTLCNNEAKVLQYKIANLEEYSNSNFELYPILHPETGAAAEPPSQLAHRFDELHQKLSRLYHMQPQAIDYSESEARLLHLSGKYYISQGYYQKGVPAIRSALSTNNYVLEHPYFHIQCLRQMTFYGIQIWDTELMEEYITKSISLAKEHTLNTEYAIECRLRGLLDSMKGDYENAWEHLLSSIELFKSSPLKEQSYGLNIAACYNYLGEVQRKQKNFEESLIYYKKAMETCVMKSCPVNATFYTNIARSHLAMQNLLEARDALKTACKLYDDTSTMMGRSIAKGYYSLLEASDGNFEKARLLLKDAMESAPRLSSPLELGLLGKTKLLLLTHFFPEFGDLITEGADNCRQQAISYLSDLPGIYELEDI